MSDVLQDAEAILNKAWHYPEDAYAAFELLPELVAEIKRPREQISRLGRLAFFAKDEPVEKIIDHFVQWGDSTFKDFQELKEQLAAKDEEIKRLRVLICADERGIIRRDTDIENLMKQLKELGLQIEQESSYVKRLEEKISDFYECDATRRGCCWQVAQDQARAALVKIREGK